MVRNGPILAQSEVTKCNARVTDKSHRYAKFRLRGEVLERNILIFLSLYIITQDVFLFLQSDEC